MKAYFARSVDNYNNLQDDRDRETIKKLGFEIIDPALKDKEFQEFKEIHNIKQGDKDYMLYFEQLVEQCDLLIFRSFIRGEIGSGVAKEIKHAEFCKIPIIELPNLITTRVLSLDDTRNYLQLLGNR